MSELQLRELEPVGLEVRGLEPEIPLKEEVCQQLRELFDEHSVLVFPDLDIDGEFQRYLCCTLIGVPCGDGQTDQDAPDAPERSRLQLVSNKESRGLAPYGRLMFHCDSMWAETVQPVISLYGVEVEQPSVPTLFVSMGDAWDTLPDRLRRRVEGLEARHGHEHTYANRGGDADVIDAYFEDSVWTTDPVASPHPRTGRTRLYVSEQMTMDICGLPTEENEELLRELFAHLYRPEQILEHHWRQHDLVVWDNTAVQHARRTVGLDGPTRTLRKVTGPMTFSTATVPQPSFSKAR